MGVGASLLFGLSAGQQTAGFNRGRHNGDIACIIIGLPYCSVRLMGAST